MSEFLNARTNRVETLKVIIRRLHAGEAPAEVRTALKKLVQETDASEIIAMEQQLISEGMPVGEIQGMCDLHSQVTREVLTQVLPSVEPGHPVDTFRRENEALRDAVARMRNAIADASAPGAMLAWRQAYNDLMDIEKHYQRKEHLVFSCLERHGINGPSKVMWAKDDEVRAVLKDLGRALRQPHDASSPDWALLASATGAVAADAIEEMIFKEENILLPMCLKTLTDGEWSEIWASSPRYGWCLVEPREGYRPAESFEPPADPRGGVQLPTGNLTIQQMTAMFAARRSTSRS